MRHEKLRQLWSAEVACQLCGSSTVCQLKLASNGPPTLITTTQALGPPQGISGSWVCLSWVNVTAGGKQADRYSPAAEVACSYCSPATERDVSQGMVLVVQRRVSSPEHRTYACGASKVLYRISTCAAIIMLIATHRSHKSS